jgi:hypothetical protein
LGLGTSLELFFKNQGSNYETSGPRVDYPAVQGPFCKISELNQNNELFFNRKPRGLGTRAVDHGRVARSTIDRWRRVHEDVREWRHARKSRASYCYEVQKLTGGGKKGRGEHGDPISGLTEAQAVVWWPGGGDEAAVKEELGGGSAQA